MVTVRFYNSTAALATDPEDFQSIHIIAGVLYGLKTGGTRAEVVARLAEAPMCGYWAHDGSTYQGIMIEEKPCQGPN